MAQIRAFTMPKWGIEMTEGTLAEWMVKEGDAFARGDTLCLIETDKITNDVDAEFDSVLRKVVAPTGQVLPVGTLLAVFAGADADDAEVEAFIAAFKAPVTSDAPGAANKASPVAASAPTARRVVDTNRPISPEALKLAQALDIDLASVEGSGRRGRITYQDVQQAARPAAQPRLQGPLELPTAPDRYFASPLARRLAAMHGVDLAAIKGTGARGRISKADVLALTTRASGGAPFAAAENRPRIVTMDRIRQVVARRLSESASTIPHIRLRARVAVDDLLALRKTANLILGVKASINDYLVRAAAVALARHPDINVQVHGETIHHFAHADIAIAVDTRKGLVTPIVRGADQMRIDQIAAATSELIVKAQAGRLAYADLDGGTFSISNLGMFGIDDFDAIINPPQGAILAVGAIGRDWREAVGGGGRFESRMTLSLSCDHRAIDGAAAAKFMETLKRLIETPEGLFE